MRAQLENVGDIRTTAAVVCGCLYCTLLGEAAQRRLREAEHELRDAEDCVAETKAQVSQQEATLQLEKTKTDFKISTPYSMS